MRSLSDFTEVWSADFEFRQPPGERPSPLCLAARELRTGRSVTLWEDVLRRYSRAPFNTGRTSLFAAYLASADLACFVELGWPLPENVIDLYAEFRLITSGRQPPCGYSLLGALAYHGLAGGVDELTKQELQDLAQRGGPYSFDEKDSLMHYGLTDADGAARLLVAMVAAIERPPSPPGDPHKALNQALLRGEYTKAIAGMELRGVPIDTEALGTLRANASC